MSTGRIAPPPPIPPPTHAQDPGISSDQPRGSYPPYDQGIELGVFVTNASGHPIVGQVCTKNSFETLAIMTIMLQSHDNHMKIM